MEYRPNWRPERTGPFMAYTNTQPRDIGPDEDGDTHSPIRSLGEYFVMKRAIKQWISPKHPTYNMIDARLDSFTNWPRGSLSPNHLAKTASLSQVNTKQFLVYFKFSKIFCFHLYPKFFTFSGRGDETICFCCGVGIHEWLSSENAWQEHARWSPYCVFVRYIRGPAFVRESRRMGSSQNTDWQEDLIYVT